ncbi:hypothetical protein [uncultured Bacteroides sp.]|uniref:hypothetical protein n=1 Tax=uncultured Bacteroides sp. TaxID=162156 RepID=UPI002AA62130|nr:hypothetical protein [uncultured Bacteroides sp.]
MTLEEMTGAMRPTNVPKTATELQNLVIKNIQSRKYQNNYEFLEDMGRMLAVIGEESLDSSKIVGDTGYKGTHLPLWDIREGMHDFFVIDPITKKSVPDPRVMLLGKMIYMVGNQSGQGHEYMYEAYCEAGKIYHGIISSLNYAWNGIGSWQA